MRAARTALLYARLIRPRLVERPFWRWRYRKGLPAADPRGLRALLPYGREADWLSRFAIHHSRVFGITLARREVYLAALSESGMDTKPLIAHADAASGDVFDVLGSGPFQQTDPIDWHLDFKSGHRWQPALFWRIDYTELGRNSDVKVPWQVARFHTGLWQGQAYWLTGKERYAAAFARQVSSWLDANPTGQGIHWACPMEMAIRAINWSWAVGFFFGSPAVPEDVWARMLASLLWHGRVIRYNLEYGRRLGNHYLSDLAGLFVLGLLFRETSEGRDWLRFARRQLEQQIRWQVHPDGVSYEKSVSYQRLVAELFVVVLALARRNDITMSPGYTERLARMLDFMRAYTRNDGSSPLVGDADDGRVLPFAVVEPITVHRHLLGVGGILLGRPDLVAVGSQDDALWLLGPDATSPAGTEPAAERSEAFPSGGFYVMRGNGCHTFLDGGPLGFENDLIHGHLDTLSLELSAPGGVFLSDSGSYLYTSDVAAYREHVETRAHNTIRVDGENIEVLRKIWRVDRDRTHPRVLRWLSLDGLDEWEAEHAGYRRLADPVVHRRRVRFDVAARRWLIEDNLIGATSHRLEVFWHCAPGVRVLKQTPSEFLLIRPGGALRLFSEVGLTLESGWVAPRYGVRLPAPVLVGRWEAKLPQRLATRLEWEPGS